MGAVPHLEARTAYRGLTVLIEHQSIQNLREMAGSKDGKEVGRQSGNRCIVMLEGAKGPKHSTLRGLLLDVRHSQRRDDIHSNASI